MTDWFKAAEGGFSSDSEETPASQKFQGLPRSSATRKPPEKKPKRKKLKKVKKKVKKSHKKSRSVKSGVKTLKISVKPPKMP